MSGVRCWLFVVCWLAFAVVVCRSLLLVLVCRLQFSSFSYYSVFVCLFCLLLAM